MNGRSSANGSSELVLHLRTVHFSLLLACFIALFSVVAGSPGVVNVAHGQLQNLLAIKEQWQSWPIRFATEELTWLQDNNAPLKSKAITARNTLYVTRAELQRLGIDSATYWNLSIQPAAFYFFSYAGSPLDFLMRKNQPYKPPQTLAYWRDSEFVVGAQSPATLLDMQEFWDGASDIGISVIEDISAQIQIVSGSSVVGSVRWQEQRPPPELSSYGSTLQPHGFLITQENCGARPWYEKIKAETDRETRTVLCGKMTDTLVQPVFSVIQRRYVVRRSLRLWLASEFSFDSDGSVFERSFSELYAVASRYRLIALEDIDAILSAEIERTGERVEILGLRLPEAALSNWGIGIIVTIQIYFLLHLQILGTRLKVNDGAVDLPWIVLYPGIPALLLSLTTISVLPVCTIGFMVIRAPSLWSLLAIPAAILAVYSAKNVLLIQRRRNALSGERSNRGGEEKRPESQENRGQSENRGLSGSEPDFRCP